MSELIRARSLTGYRELVRELGGDPQSLLARFSLDAALLDDDEATIAYGNVIRLLEATAEVLSCPDFGLRLAQRQSLHVLGPLALLAQNSSTVAEGFLAVSRYMNYHSMAIRVTVDADPNPRLRRITFAAVVRSCPRRRQVIELSLRVMLGALQLMAGRSVTADHVLFLHAAGLPLRRYRDWFSCPVLFGQDVNALVVQATTLRQSIDQSNRDLLRIAEAHVAAIVAQRPLNTLGQVRALVERLLATGHCTLTQVAGCLSMHERTLQRRLAVEGTYFDKVLDQIRRERAEEYLAQKGIPMAQVAALLGFAEQSSFNPACRRWFGAVPKAVRIATLADMAGH